MNYDEMKTFYKQNYSLGYLNTSIQNKFALISLVGALTYEAKKKVPGINCYQILRKVSDGMSIPDDYIESLSIVCEDFAYGCKEFITFGLKPNQYAQNIKKILDSYIPF